MDTRRIKDDFPQFSEAKDGALLRYLDSAASSLTPHRVLDAVDRYYREDRANVHRGDYPEAVRATERYEEARRSVALLIGAKPEEIVFTSGATGSSNMLARSLDESAIIGSGDRIVTSVMEHHASLLPLQAFAKRRSLALEHIPIDGDLRLDLARGEALIDERTRVVSVMLASNVTGARNDVARIAAMAHERGAIVVTDATAALGHVPVDVRALDVDMLYYSGHKMFAPTGVGVLYLKEEFAKRLSPSEWGGGMIDEVTLRDASWTTHPEKFEAGTKDISGAIGLGEAARYLLDLGVDRVHAHTSELVSYAVEKLSRVPGVRVFAERDPERNVGIVSFAADWAHPHDISEILSRDRVAVRAGHHCAMPLHCELKLVGTVRASFHIYNDRSDVDALAIGVEKARGIFA